MAPRSERHPLPTSVAPATPGRRVLPSFPMSGPAVTRAVLIGLALASLVFVAWQLADVLLLAFAALLVAQVLSGLADLIVRYTRLSYRWALLVSCAGIAVLAGAVVYAIGMQLSGQLGALIAQLPRMIRLVGESLGVPELDQNLVARLRQFLQSGTAALNFADYFGTGVQIVLSAIIVLAAGIYLAVDPRLYRNGALLLVPQGQRDQVARAASRAGQQLRMWLAGQLLVMLIVGVTTGLAMSLLGLSSPLALGFVAGVLEFIPIVGPIMAAVPSVVIALTGRDPTLVYWVIGAYVAIQQVESNLIVPLIQRWAVKLPPVVGLFSIAAAGVLFGPLGILLATPLAVVAMTLVRELYVRDALGEGPSRASAET